MSNQASLIGAGADYQPKVIVFHAQERFFMTAARRRLRRWSRMTSKQKLADMEKEDHRRKNRAPTGCGSGFHADKRGSTRYLSRNKAAP